MRRIDKARRKPKAAYDVTGPKGRRNGEKRFRIVKSEAGDMPPDKAAELAANAHDAVQNQTLAAWALKTHLDHTTGFTPQAHVGEGDEAEKRAEIIEGMIRWQSAPERFSASGLFGMHEGLRLLESSAVLDGDGLWSILDGGEVQGIEGSRIVLPGYGSIRNVGEWADWDNDGIDRDEYGRHLRYCICRYDVTTGQMVYDQTLPAGPVVYCDWRRRFDQLRGVSPMASALITMRDLYASMGYTLLKMRLHAMLGVAIIREVGGAVDGIEEGALGLDETSTTTNATTGNTVKQVDVTLRDGVAMFDLDPGEDIKFLDSNTPSPNVKDYQQDQIRMALKCLDIPYSMFDPAGSNHAQRKADAMQYWHACEWRRERLRNVLHKWLTWQAQNWAFMPGPRFDRYRAALVELGIRDPAEVADLVTWQPRGISSLAAPDAAEVAQDIAIGRTSYQRVAAEYGTDFRENVRDIGAAMKYAAEHGAPISVGAPGQAFAGQQNQMEPEVSNGQDQQNQDA